VNQALKIASEMAEALQPDFSPHADRIVFAFFRPGENQLISGIYVKQFGGGNINPLTSGKRIKYLPKD
jgi:hypothetical protein